MKQRKGCLGLRGFHGNELGQEGQNEGREYLGDPEANHNGVCVLLVSNPAGDGDNSHNSTVLENV